MERLEQELKKLETERMELVNRLYYCSNTGEGKKMRREIQKRLSKIDKEVREIEKLRGVLWTE